MAEQQQWSVDDFRKFRDQKAKEEKSKRKYRNKKVVVDGYKFDSIKESSFYGECKLKKMAGKIRDFKMQVIFHFVLNGVKIGYYKADFVIELLDGSFQVIDVKSDFTRKLPRYRKQKKLMLAFHNINIIEK